jgi:RES domain-containing protein
VILRSWRMVKRKYASDAFSGEGSRRNGGRWNSPGTPVVYTAENASLAVLEILVQPQVSGLLPDFVLFRVEFEQDLVETLDDGALPSDWRAYPAPAGLRAIGDAWLADSRSVALSVPSAIVPLERLYLLNPLHSDFPQISIGEQQLFPMDARLMKE